MASLQSKTQNTTLLSQLRRAETFSSRAKGLIGTKNLTAHEGVWFPKCNWIHTFFMSIPIDVIYLDKDFRVKDMHHNVRPWRLAKPVFSADSVIEIASGQIKKLNINLGDKLHVGD